MVNKIQDFSRVWAEKGDEKQHTQSFWITFLRDVVGMSQPEKVIDFEKRVKIDNIKYIDAYIAETRVAIEQKGAKIDLDKPEKQSDGEELTPFEQAKRYNDNLPFSEKCRWIVVCNFKEFRIHDMEHPEPAKHFETILLEELPKQYHRFQFLIDQKNENIRREEQISMEAGKLVDKLYQALLPQYKNPNETALRSLNILCVRIVFCLYAEDAGLFEKRTSFEDYIKSFNLPNVRKGLMELFKALDTQLQDRDQYDELLKPFPYVNGGLFKDEDIEIPNFTQEIVDVIVEQCAPFDWSEISPTIFGAVFESTLNPETRRSGGMHYTSVQNIHKVIDPLFLDDLQAEFEQICATKVAKQKNEALHAFQKKLGSLTFLDPACGSGNFLTETYLSLRRLENKVIALLNKGNRVIGFDEFIHVHINQFYGIEINDFAVTVAKTALWIAESQMVAETEKILSKNIDFLPLTTNAFIVEGNALRMDWATLKPLEANAMPTEGLFAGFATQTDGSEIQYDYIMGNPPFQGARLMNEEQKADLFSVFNGVKNNGNLDYVACWYKKAAEYMQNNQNTRTALVSTNSITQGEQVAILWQSLCNLGVEIDFAYRTFKWDNQSIERMAHVHCVIVGFSFNSSSLLYKLAQTQKTYSVLQSIVKLQEKLEEITKTSRKIQEAVYSAKKIQRILYDESGIAKFTQNINAYLIDAPDVFIESRKQKLCDVPDMVFGSMPNDSGNFILSEEEKENFIKKEPLSEKYIRLFLGAEEFINNKKRYCLWLKGISPAELKKMPLILKRVEAVRNMRLSSKRDATQKLANTPHLFGEIRQPEIGTYLLVPSTSSERRKYIPMGFFDASVISSNANLIIPNATLYHFGVLTSSVHMAWMRAVCGRLKSDYRYSKDIVYNNFPWPFYLGEVAQINGGVKNSSSKLEEVSEGRRSMKNNNLLPLTPSKIEGEQKAKIEATAQAILDARANYPDSSLADLYDELTMPADLRKAHQANDKAVMQAYGFDPKMPENEIVAELFKLYEDLTK